MRYLTILALIFAFAVPIGMANDVKVLEIHDGDEVLVYKLQKPKVPIIWRLWTGVNITRYGFGPSIDVAGRKGRWGLKGGINIFQTLDYKCEGALRCSDIDPISRLFGSGAPIPPAPEIPNGYTQHSTHIPVDDTRPVVVQSRQTESMITLMFSWTLPQ